MFQRNLRVFFSLGLLFLPLAFQSATAAEGNPVKGAELFKQCMVCHAVGDGAESPVGPHLNHIFGRRAGTIEGYNYSDAMRAKGESDGLIWDEKSLYIFIAGPDRYVKGTTMGFPGLRREKEIKDLLSWLIQYSPAYEAGSGAEVDAASLESATLPEAPSSEEEAEIPNLTAEYLANDEAIAIGGELWSKQCRHCHGNSAYPGKAPKLKPASYEPDFVFSRITDGFKKMPAWKSVFSLEERKALVAYVLSNKFSP